MNFHVVDGDNQYREFLPVFSEMYNDKQMRVATIKEQLGLCQNDYRKLRRDAIQEGLVKPRPVGFKRKTRVDEIGSSVVKNLFKRIILSKRGGINGLCN